MENAFELRRNPIQVIDLIDGHDALLEFTYITNPGAAWSMFSEYPQYLTLLAFVALLQCFVQKAFGITSHASTNYFWPICGGICGNLSDRLFREPAE